MIKLPRWLTHPSLLRLRTAQEFKAGKSPIMLATDVAARGLGALSLPGSVQACIELVQLAGMPCAVLSCRHEGVCPQIARLCELRTGVPCGWPPSVLCSLALSLASPKTGRLGPAPA
jgi:hypothetical protein